MKPITLWLAGIAALVALLILRGGFQRPLMFFVIGVIIVSLLVGFFLFRRGQPSDDRTESQQSGGFDTVKSRQPNEGP